MTHPDRSHAIFAVFAAGILLILVLFSQPLYDDVDNYTVAIVVNGLYGRDNGCQYTHVLLNGLMSCLSGLLPGADVFTLLSRLLIPTAFALLLYHLGHGTGNRLATGALFTFFLFLSVCIPIFQGNYGIQAIFFTGTGLTLLGLSGANKKDTSITICGCVYLVVGFLWRLQVSLLYVPFLLLEVICGKEEKKWGEKQSLHEQLRRFAVPVLLILLVFGVQSVQEHREPLSSSLAYDRPRIRYQDYGAKDWPEVAEEAGALGITHAEYEMVDQWLLLDTGTITAGKLEDIASISPKTDYPLTAEGLFEAARVLRGYFVGESIFNYVWLAGILLGTLVLLVTSPTVPRRLQALLILSGGQLIIFIYLVRGRAPMRLIHSVYLVQSFSLLWEGFRIRRDVRAGLKNFTALCLAGLLFLFGISGILALKASGLGTPQLAWNARLGADDSELRVQDEDGIIIWDNWGRGFNRPLMKQGKLPTPEMLSRQLPAGDWVYGQSYYVSFLERLGLSNPYEALFNNPHMYYAVSEEYPLLLYAEHTPGFHAEPCGSVSGTPVYRFVRSEEAPD